ncbi:MAG: recombinase family protein [Clostridium sp.]|nr:recombinase family protein [Clostridium sp.]
MIYGYARVSTKGQARDGNSLEAQETKLRENGAEVIYADSFTGTKKNRPQLDLLLENIQSGDTLIVTKLDRFARSTRQGLEIIDEFKSKGVIVNILNMGLLDNTPTGKLMYTMFLAFAEFERDMIVERTNEGKEIARLDPDFHEGRPKKDVTINEYFNLVQQGKKTVTECCNELGISRGTWYSRIKEIA